MLYVLQFILVLCVLEFIVKHCVLFQAQELKVLQGKTPRGLWNEDLDLFMEELDVSCCIQLTLCVNALGVITSKSMSSVKLCKC